MVPSPSMKPAIHASSRFTLCSPIVPISGFKSIRESHNLTSLLGDSIFEVLLPGRSALITHEAVSPQESKQGATLEHKVNNARDDALRGNCVDRIKECHC